MRRIAYAAIAFNKGSLSKHSSTETAHAVFASSCILKTDIFVSAAADIACISGL